MTDTISNDSASRGATGTESPLTLALSVSAFFVVSYVLCVAGVVVLPPGGVVHRLLGILPGFAWNPGGITRGLVAAVGAGIYVGLVYGLIHRAIVKRGWPAPGRPGAPVS